MGTSVRKTSAKIKKLLKEAIETNPSVKPEEVLVEVATQTIKSKRTKTYFADKDFIVLSGGGMQCFSRIASIGFERFYEDYNVDPSKLTTIDIQKIIETILDDIERVNGDIQSSFILNAFKSAMSKALLNEISDPVVFLNIFCEIFLEMIIREEASEELLEQFKEYSPESFDKAISDFSKKYVEASFAECISDCVRQKVDIQFLISKLQNCIK